MDYLVSKKVRVLPNKYLYRRWKWLALSRIGPPWGSRRPQYSSRWRWSCKSSWLWNGEENVLRRILRKKRTGNWKSLNNNSYTIPSNNILLNVRGWCRSSGWQLNPWLIASFPVNPTFGRTESLSGKFFLLAEFHIQVWIWRSTNS